MRAVFDENKQLSKDGGYLLDWMVRNYLDSTLMLLRREMDVQPGTENLTNLLLDISTYPQVLSRGRVRARWNKTSDLGSELADHSMNRLELILVPGNSDEDHIDPVVISTDLSLLKGDVEQMRKFAERTRAHRTPTPKTAFQKLTYGKLHKALEDIQGVTSKYLALLTAKSVAQWEPVAQFNVLKPFLSPWVERSAMARVVSASKK